MFLSSIENSAKENLHNAVLNKLVISQTRDGMKSIGGYVKSRQRFFSESEKWPLLVLQDCTMKALINFSFMLILTQLGRVILLIVALSPVIVSFLALLSLHGSLRNRPQCLVLVRRLSFEPLPLLHRRLYGFDGSLLILVCHVMHPPRSFVIVLLLFRLPMIRLSIT